jgi:hypothetical protein
MRREHSRTGAGYGQGNGRVRRNLTVPHSSEKAAYLFFSFLWDSLRAFTTITASEHALILSCSCVLARTYLQATKGTGLMSIFLRLTFHTVLLLGLVVGLGYSQPVWVKQVGLDFWSLPQLERELAEEIERDRRLMQNAQDLKKLYAGKTQVLRQLIRGEISLQRAADEVSRLTQPETLQIMVRYGVNQRGNTFRERLGWMVIEMAEFESASAPEEVVNLRHRLEAEWERDFLPAASPANPVGEMVAQGKRS